MNLIEKHFDRSPVPRVIREIPFGEALWPWLGAAREGVKDHLGLQLLKKEAIFSLEKSLLLRWSSLCAPSFTIEMAICKQTFTLEGATPQERYRNFIEHKLLNLSNLRNFFLEYHTLEQMALKYLELWCAQVREFLDRLIKDHEALSLFSGGKDVGKVVKLETSLGDPHNGGKSVYLLTFECGAEIYYKPKDLHIVKAYHDFLEKLHQLGLQPVLQGYLVLPRDGYGWEERVFQKECRSKKEVAAYFERAGMHLALLYLLDGNDVHNENLIASGAFPTLIDLETLFHATLKTEEMKVDALVLKIGMLPSYVMGKLGRKGVDISALGGEEGQSFPMQGAKWSNKNTDEMRLVYKYFKSQDGKHRVTCHGKKKFAHDYIEEIVGGFRKTFYFLMAHRKEIGKSLEKMAPCRVRFILRATRLYFHILQRLKDPQVLLHPELIEKEFHPLHLFLQEKRHGVLIEEEKKALLQGDVPFFTTIVGTKDIYVQDQKVLADAFEESPFEKAKERLEKLSEEGCRLQIRLIREAFQQKSAPTTDVEVKCEQTSGEIKREEILFEAKKIGNFLKTQAFYLENGSVNWLNLEPNAISGQFQLQPISENLYGGKAGVALFFAALAKATGVHEWEELCGKTLNDVCQKIETGNAARIVGGCGVGGFSGAPGMAWTLYNCGKILERKEWIEKSKILLSSITKKNIEEDKAFDIIAGSAGLLLVLSSFEKDEVLTQVGDMAASHLVKNALMNSSGARWPNHEGVAHVGFSHGTAGIAHALFKWGNEDYYSVAKEALGYERTRFNPTEKNWPTFFEKKYNYPTKWCHGATGIGMGKLATLPYFKDEMMFEEIKTALETTRAHIFQGNPLNLCCSTLGRIEFLMEASKEMGEEYRKEARHTFGAVFETFKNQEITSPGLMQGGSGWGYFLLRQLDPTLPQVLLLS